MLSMSLYFGPLIYSNKLAVCDICSLLRINVMYYNYIRSSENTVKDIVVVRTS